MHLDKHLGNIIAEQGRGRAYALLAAIVFCETGLVRSAQHNARFCHDVVFIAFMKREAGSLELGEGGGHKTQQSSHTQEVAPEWYSGLGRLLLLPSH
jgi:hypothetical protein